MYPHTFHGLLRTQLDKLCPAKRDSHDVGEDIVGDYQADRQEEPDHALKYVVHDEVSLHHDQVERHVCPSELCELESIMVLLERCHEENESYGPPRQHRSAPTIRTEWLTDHI